MSAFGLGSARPVQPVKGVANGHPGAMQQHPHIALAYLKQGTDFRRIKVLLTTQDQHRALRRGQGFNDLFDMLEHASPFDMPFGREVFPEFRQAAPMAAAIEGVGQPVTAAVIVEEDGPPLAPCAAARLVEEDRIDPAGKRSAPLEKIDAVEHGHPGVLHHIFGDGAAFDDASRKADHRGSVLSIKAVEGRSIAVNETQSEHAILVVNLPHAVSPSHAGSIDETFAVNVQPQSAPSSHSDFRCFVGETRVFLQDGTALKGAFNGP